MTDREDRRKAGDAVMHQVTGLDAHVRRTPLLDTKRGFVMAEVWGRPGLAPRYRYLITLSCLGNTMNAPELRTYLRAALQTEALTLLELREFVLHFAVYCGWHKGEFVDDILSEVADDLGLADAEPDDSLTLEQPARTERGKACWESVMTFPPPDATPCYSHAGMLNFVFGEMWDRPGLDRVSRRYITLACVGLEDGKGPIASHVYAAMNTGQVKLPEMREFVLHFAVSAGWPKASLMHSMCEVIAGRVEAGESFFDLI